MESDYLVTGIIVIFFAAILLGDAIMTTTNPAGMVLSPNDVKGITGMVFAAIAGFFFLRAWKE